MCPECQLHSWIEGDLHFSWRVCRPGPCTPAGFPWAWTVVDPFNDYCLTTPCTPDGASIQGVLSGLYVFFLFLAFASEISSNKWCHFYDKNYSVMGNSMGQFIDYLYPVSFPDSKYHWRMLWIVKEKSWSGKAMLRSQWSTHSRKSDWALNLAVPLQKV